MSVPGPVQRWRDASGLTGPEARAASLFSKVLPPREVAPAVQAQHLSVLRGDVLAPRRFRVPAPAAVVAVFFGASMALAATRPAVREWVQVQLESVGVLTPAPKTHASAALPVTPAAPVAPLEVVQPPVPQEEAVTLEEIDVTMDGGPKLAVSKTPPKAAPRPSAVAPKPVAPVAAAPATPKPVSGVAETAAQETPPIPADVAAAQQKPASGGSLGEDLPADMTALPMADRIEVLLEHGDIEEAAEVVGVMKDDHSDKMNLLRGEVLQARDRCREANVYYSSVIDTKGLPLSFYERALYGRAVCHAKLGNGAASHVDIDRHVSMFPNGRFKEADRKLHQQ
jgi:hypothetical protein